MSVSGQAMPSPRRIAFGRSCVTMPATSRAVSCEEVGTGTTPAGDGPQIGDREIHAVAQPHEQGVAGLQPGAQQPVPVPRTAAISRA